MEVANPQYDNHLYLSKFLLQLLGDFSRGPALMDALVNAIFVTSPGFQEIGNNAIPANVVSIVFLPICNECRLVMSHDISNATITEVHDK